MSTQTTITLLGTGSSGGVPRVGNQWGKCDPTNPKNRRRRCAALFQTSSSQGTTSALVDAGADLREQLLSANVTHLDGVLLTHSHADHIFGLDDLRQLALVVQTPIPVHMDELTAKIVMPPFGYIFHQAPTSSYPAFCSDHLIDHHRETLISGLGGDLAFQPIVADHGDIHSLGFRVNDAAYLPDMKRIADNRGLEALQDLDVLIVDALREKNHPAHMSLTESLAFIEAIKPKRAVLTNMHSDLDYEALKERLPVHIEPGYDGMQITT